MWRNLEAFSFEPKGNMTGWFVIKLESITKLFVMYLKLYTFETNVFLALCLSFFLIPTALCRQTLCSQYTCLITQLLVQLFFINLSKCILMFLMRR